MDTVRGPWAEHPDPSGALCRSGQRVTPPLLRRVQGAARQQPRVLIVDCFSDRERDAAGSPRFVPQSFTPIYLAGALRAENVDVDVHSEFNAGPLTDLGRLARADLLVLTGTNASFDRMRHLTAYARILSPRVRVAVGGSLARTLPRLCARWFDYVCQGDVEQLADVARDCLGPTAAAEEVFPRYDLAYGLSFVGYAESSRNCNFRCAFCSMTAEGRVFMTHPPDFIRRQIVAMGYKQGVILVDQNFFGGPRQDFEARLAMLERLYREQRMAGWAAMLTADFFARPEYIEQAAAAGCIGFYSGVESFSAEQIRAFRKRQNLVLPQEQVIRRCLEAGMVFHYGLVFDPCERTCADFQAELDLIVSNPRITLPAFISIAIPILGTPLFRRRLAEGAFLPGVLLRDMEGISLLCRPLEPLAIVAPYVRKVQTRPLPTGRLLAHAARFAWRYRGTLGRWAMASALLNTVSMGLPALGSNRRERRIPLRQRRSSFVSGTEAPGSLYRPAIAVPAALRGHFVPQPITDSAGALHPDLWDDLGQEQVGTGTVVA